MNVNGELILASVSACVDAYSYWYRKSQRHQRFMWAVEQLATYNRTVQATLADRYEGKPVHDNAAFIATCWHWNASWMWLCSRSPVCQRLHTSKGTSAVEAWMKVVADDHCSADMLIAHCRNACFAVDMVRRKAVPEMFAPTGARAAFLSLVVRSLKLTLTPLYDFYKLSATQLFRVVILNNDIRHVLFTTRAELMAFHSWLHSEIQHQRNLVPDSVAASVIAEFIVGARLPVFNIVNLLQQSTHQHSPVEYALQVTCQLLIYLESTSPDYSRFWRRQLTSALLEYLVCSSRHLRHLAFRCLRWSDSQLLMKFIVDEVEVTAPLAAAFSCWLRKLPEEELEVQLHTLLDCYCAKVAEDVQPQKVVSTPAEMYAAPKVVQGQPSAESSVISPRLDE
ncbi:TPA: hypothetical protein N0F65_003872 [Lagenidium giganteum]|uniref:Uncharacterized protein n=1 Tax=Lagenidium giganteum TaxID=4803 RepID=A0AAV2ZC80_9STRA|nr:TPA: hypothetical protein N0F65_003872 [Lagenidium giganteum]